jgi:putative DNA primase/helicase
VIVHGKSSLARKGASLAFTIVDDGGAAAVHWLGTCELDAETLLAPREVAKDQLRDDGPRAEAREVLGQILADGPMAADDVEREAKTAGIAKRTLMRAKRELKVRSRRVRGDDGKFFWRWSLPAASDRSGGADEERA